MIRNLFRAFALMAIACIAFVSFSDGARASEAPVRGLFIGSFDPITNAHVQVVMAGVIQLGLQEVIIVVNSASGKDYSASFAERVAMVKAAVKAAGAQDRVRFVVVNEPPEGKRELAIQLAAGSKDGILHQIAGDDVQSKAKELFGALPQVKSYILPRLGDDGKVGQIKEGFHLLQTTEPSGVSSTEVKRRRLAKQSIIDLVPESVLAFIQHHKLYRPLGERELILRRQMIDAQVALLIRSSKDSGFANLDFTQLREITGTTVRGEISTVSSLDLNPLQSQGAVEDLLARRLVAGNPGLTSEGAYVVRRWVGSTLSSAEGHALKAKILGGRCDALFLR